MCFNWTTCWFDVNCVLLSWKRNFEWKNLEKIHWKSFQIWKIENNKDNNWRKQKHGTQREAQAFYKRTEFSCCELLKPTFEVDCHDFCPWKIKKKAPQAFFSMTCIDDIAAFRWFDVLFIRFHLRLSSTKEQEKKETKTYFAKQTQIQWHQILFDVFIAMFTFLPWLNFIICYWITHSEFPFYPIFFAEGFFRIYLEEIILVFHPLGATWKGSSLNM